MLRQYFLLLFFSYLGIVTLSGQASTPLDSLIAACNAYSKEDTTKAKMLIGISLEYLKSDPIKGAASGNEAVELARRLNQPILIARALIMKGNNESATGEYEKTILTLEEALQICKAQGHVPKLESDIINNIGVQYYYKHDFKQAFIYFEQAYQSKLSLGDVGGAANALGNMGNVSSEMADFPKALLCFDQAITMHEKARNTTGKANVIRNKGNIYNLTGNYPKALDYFYQALAIYQKNGLVLFEGDLYLSLGVTYRNLYDFPKSIEYNQKALAIYQKMENKSYIAEVDMNIAENYRALKNYTVSLEWLQKALPLVLELNDEGLIAYCYNQLGRTYYDKNDFSRAFEYYQKSMVIEEKLGTNHSVTLNYRQLGNLYLNAPDSVLLQVGVSAANRYTVAEEFYMKDLKLAEELGQIAPASAIWLQLSQLYEKTGQFIKAYEAYKNYVVLNDSILGEDTKKQITRKEIQYEFDKKEATLKFEQQLTLDQLEQQKLLSIQQQQALTLNEQSLALSNKEADLQRLAYLKEKAEKQEKEQQLSLAEKDKQLQDIQLGSLIQEKALQLKTLAEKNALIGFLLAGISAVLLAFAAFYWWIRQRQAKKEAATQAQFTRQLLEHVEDDRGRIAIDLHDSVSHDLLLLKQSIRKEITGPEVGDKIDNIINGIRQISRNLHPVMLDKIGLRLSLETLCEQFMQHETMYVSHEIDYQNTLPKTAELQLFRIVQEGLTNALKYSKAEAVKVQIKYSGTSLQLEIQDNGKGFEVGKALEGGKAFGLHSIIQRAKAIGGKAEIRSGEGGTSVHVVIGV